MAKVNWKTVGILVMFVALALFIRAYFAWEPSVTEDFSVSGGSDSYYYERLIDYFVENHHYLRYDPMLNYPLGAANPRRPFFVVSTVAMGYLAYPVFGNLHDGVYAALILSTAIWGALSVIPMYLLGKEMFNRRVGIIAAFLLAVSPAHLMRSVATNADHDSLVLFFSIWVFYFFFKAIKYAKRDMWIDNWRSWKTIKSGFRAFMRENKLALIYSALAGTSLLVIMLSWKGFPYIETILVIYIGLQLFINRFKNQSTLHLFMITLVFTVVSFGGAYPVYGPAMRWYITPLILMLGVLAIALFFEITVRYPWTFLFPLAVLTIGIGVVAMYFLLPDLFKYIVTGQGYFIKTKLYSTIAEAQPAAMGSLIISIGVGVFFLALAGLGYILWGLRKNLNEVYLFIVIYTLVSIYMAISAARFIFNAAPAFALASSFFIDYLLLKLVQVEKKPKAKKWRERIKRVFSARNVVTFAIALFVISPNVWSAVDAGIPYESKSTYDKQIYDLMPPFWKPEKRGRAWYLGAFGYSIPKKTYAWSRAWEWLSEQDSNIYPEEDRPAFISWWDYGFEAIHRGKHPTVADNFQYGYQLAGQAITAQNETEVMALFAARIIEGDYEHNDNKLSATVEGIIKRYLGDDGLKEVYDIFSDPLKYKEDILKNPDKYGGPYSNDISDKNCKYVALKGLFVTLGEDGVLNLLKDLERATGYSIRYFAIDYRLFPFNARNTGIFYAPAKLSDRRILEARGMSVPIDFYEIKLVDQYGNEYSPDEFPPGSRVQDYRITYKDMFYHCMLYRIFVGYSGKDIGKGDGIPGISQSLLSEYPMQAWNLTHFKLVYRTAFWNPYKDYQNHSDAWKAIPIDKALEYQREGIGVVELNPPASQVLPNDVVIVKFYEGAIVEGYVRLEDGTPLKKVRVTLFDEYGIPHTSVLTDSNGHYRLYAIAGNGLEIKVTTGGDLDKKMLTEKTVLATWKFNVTEEQAMQLPVDKDHDGLYDYFIKKDFVIKGGGAKGAIYMDLNKNGKVDNDDVKFNGKVILKNDEYNISFEDNLTNGYYEINDLPPYKYDLSIEIFGKKYENIGNITINVGGLITKDFPLKPCTLNISIKYGVSEEEDVSVWIRGTDLDIEYHNYTGTNGTVKFYLPPGHYKVYAEKGNVISDEQSVVFDDWNQSFSLNLELNPAYKLVGRITGVGDREVTVKIENELTHEADIFIAKNSFERTLTKGIYTVYAECFVGNEKYVFFTNVYLDENKTVDISMKKAYVFSGTVYNNKTKVPADVVIFQGSTFLREHTDDKGNFKIYLPAGQYNVGVVQFGTPYSSFFSIKINSDRNMEIQLGNNTIVHGNVLMKNESIGEGLLFVKSKSLGNCYLINTPKSGNFTVTAPRDFVIDLVSLGYETVDREGNESKYVIQVVQLPVTLRGYIMYENETYTWESVNIQFVSKENIYTTHSKDGFYTIQLPPGTYNITIFGDKRKYAPIINKITVTSGEKIRNVNLPVQVNVEVKFNTSAESINIYDATGKLITTGHNITVRPGDYYIYAYSEGKVFFDELSLMENGVIDIPLVSAYRLNVQIENYTGFANVLIKGDMAIMQRGTYGSLSLFLPPGNYSLNIDMTKEEEGIKYRYYGYAEIKNLNSDETIKLRITKIRLRAKIDMKITVGGKEASFATAILQNPALEKKLVADEYGEIHDEIPPGKYSLYIYLKINNTYYAFLGKKDLIAGSNLFEIKLKKAYEMRGGVYIGNEKLNTYIHIENYDYRIPVVDGLYWIYLPVGKYNMSVSVNRYEYGLQIVYNWRGEIDIARNIIYDIYLKRDSVHDVSVEYVGEEVKADVGDWVPLIFKAINHGNDKETLEFSLTNNWNVSFIPEKLTIFPGETKYFTAMVQVPKDASLGNNTITLRVKYADKFADAHAYVNVSEYYSLTLTWKNNRTTSQYIEFGVDVKNNGNVGTTFNLTIINSEELQDKGWYTEIYFNNSKADSIDLDSGESKRIYVRIRRTIDNPARSVRILLMVYNNNVSKILEIKATYASLSIEKVDITGNVLIKPPDITAEIMSWAIASVVIVVAGVAYSIIMRRRYPT